MIIFFIIEESGVFHIIIIVIIELSWQIHFSFWWQFCHRLPNIFGLVSFVLKFKALFSFVRVCTSVSQEHHLQLHFLWNFDNHLQGNLVS